MPEPEFATELAQAVYLVAWLSPTIPSLAGLVRPFRDILDCVYQQKGTRKSRSLIGVKLESQGWNETHDQLWCDFLIRIEKALRLTLYDPEKELAILSDASSNFWSAIITQFPAADLGKPLIDQRHSPLFCLSGQFRDNSLNWHISQKEFYPVLFTLQRMD